MARDPLMGGEAVQFRDRNESCGPRGKSRAPTLNIMSDSVRSMSSATLAPLDVNDAVFDVSTSEPIDYNDPGFDVAPRRSDLELTLASVMRPPAHGWMA